MEGRERVSGRGWPNLPPSRRPTSPQCSPGNAEGNLWAQDGEDPATSCTREITRVPAPHMPPPLQCERDLPGVCERGAGDEVLSVEARKQEEDHLHEYEDERDVFGPGTKLLYQ